MISLEEHSVSTTRDNAPGKLDGLIRLIADILAEQKLKEIGFNEKGANHACNRG